MTENTTTKAPTAAEMRRALIATGELTRDQVNAHKGQDLKDAYANLVVQPAAAKAAEQAPAKKEAATKKVRAYKVPKGYEVKWQHGGHDLLAKVDADAKGPKWFTACNEHGDLAEANSAKEAELLGVLKTRATWCKGDHKPAAKKAPAKKAPAKKTAAKK